MRREATETLQPLLMVFELLVFLPKMELARSMLKRENESLLGRPGKIKLEERWQ
jgi:hypothetical protein